MAKFFRFDFIPSIMFENKYENKYDQYFDSKTTVGFKYTFLLSYFSFDQKLLISLNISSKFQISFKHSIAILIRSILLCFIFKN